MATEVFKIVNDMSPEYIKDLITIQNSSYNFRRENQASIPQVKSTKYGLRSFRYETARIWNCLPNDLRKAESVPQFRRLLHAWDGIICKCPSCSVYTRSVLFMQLILRFSTHLLPLLHFFSFR